MLLNTTKCRYAAKILKGSGVVKSHLNSHMCMKEYSKIVSKCPPVFINNSKLSQVAGIHSWNMRFMSKQKVVFTSDPRGEEKKANPMAELVEETSQPIPNLMSERKNANQLSYRSEGQKFMNIGHAKKAYYEERMEIYEMMKEKWIHNSTKKFDESLYEDRIESLYKELTKEGQFGWIEQADVTASGSSDPLATILLNVIQQNQQKEEQGMITPEEFKRLPIEQSLPKLKASFAKITTLDDSMYSELRKKAVKSLCSKDSHALEIMKSGFLGKNMRFVNLVTDMFVNTFNPTSANPHQCLKDFMYFTFLLSESKGSQEYHSIVQNTLIDQIFFEPGHFTSIKELNVSTEMSVKFMYLHIMKKYNYFHNIDAYFRELGKVFLELKQEGVGYPAENYQRLLNSEFFVQNEVSETYVDAVSFGYKKTKLDDIPIQQSFLKQPETIYSGKAEKAKVIEDYKKMIVEFEKVKELKSFLANSLENPKMLSQLLTNMKELTALFNAINGEEKHLVDDGTLDRVSKICSNYSMVVEDYIFKTFGIRGVSLENMHDIFNPLHNGQFNNMLATRDKLIKEGLTLEEANRLAEEYCRRTQELSKGPYKLYNLIESHLDESQEAISNFHKCESMKNVNFSTPTLSELRFSIADRVRKAGHLNSYLMAGGDLNEYNKLANSVFNNKQSEEPVRLRKGSMAYFSTRNFCSKNEPETKSGGFTEYLKKLIKFDKTNEEESKAQKKDLESIITKDPADIKIGFHKMKSSITLDDEASSQSIEGQDAADANNLIMEEAKKTEDDLLVEEAKERYSLDFFKEFSLSDSKLMQASLEEYVRDMKNKEDLPLFVASLIANAYPLNSWIPNSHLVFYQMFCSPRITKENRTNAEGEDLLAGNIFNDSVSIYGYKSLLHSALITGKKKHFKKILKHMEIHLEPEQINDELMAKIIDVAISHDFPILLGTTISNYMSRGVKISKQNYMNFCLYLDRCKGLEKETLRFINAVNDTEHIQMDWEFVRPFFIRALNFKKGQDILELFEIIKGKLILNKANEQLTHDERTKSLNKIRGDFYRNLITELLEKRAFSIADIIYLDYRQQLPYQDPNDLLGLKICCLKRDIDSFEEQFTRQLSISATSALDSDDKHLTEKSIRQLSDFIMLFKSEENSQKVLEMTSLLFAKIKNDKMDLSGPVYKNLVTIAVSYQQWDVLKEVLKYTQDEVAESDTRLLQYIKENLIYCVDINLRTDIREIIDRY